jgi:DNA polymerase III epsilon subunit-like protein
MKNYDFLASKNANANAIVVSQKTEDAMVVLLKEVLLTFGEEWKKSFSYTFIFQQLEAMMKDPRGMRWNPDVVSFFSTISYYGGKKVYNILRGKAFEGQGKTGKLTMAPSLFNLHVPSLSVFQHRRPKVDPYGSRKLVPLHCRAIAKMFGRLMIWEQRRRKGGLVFDEIEIRHGLGYLKKSQQLIGLASGPILVESLAGCDHDYKNELSQKICQCFFVSNCGKICIPLHYFPTVSVSANELFEVTEYLKNCLLEERISVVWTSTDGFRGSLDFISKESSCQPSRHFFDYVHMVKLGRNQLLNRQLQFRKEGTIYCFSMKDLLLWWQDSPYLRHYLTLDDIHPSDKQDISPVKNLLAAIPVLGDWGLSLSESDIRKHQCEGMCLYLKHFDDLYTLFSNNDMSMDAKILVCERLRDFFLKWKTENSSMKSFISEDLYRQILVTLESFLFFFRPKPDPGDEENIVFTSILGTNIVENFFSLVRAKILFPNLWEYACVSHGAYLELVKRFSSDRLHSLPNRPLSRRWSLKYNDQSGIMFDKNDLFAILSLEFRNDSDTNRKEPSDEQKVYATSLATEYRCTRKKLTTRQKTCKQEESELLVEIDKLDQNVGIFPCFFTSCPKSYTYAGAYRNHLLKVHGLHITGDLSGDLAQYQQSSSEDYSMITEGEKMPSKSMADYPSTPPLYLSFYDDEMDEVQFQSSSLHTNEVEFPEVEVIQDTEPCIIEDEKESEEKNLQRNEEKENEVVAIVFWDLETSGKHPSSNVEYIIEIGCVGWKLNMETATENFSSLVNPQTFNGECSITPKASQVSGLYMRDVLKESNWDSVYIKWIEYLSNLRRKHGKILMLAHNSRNADENCLKCDCERYRLIIPSYLIFGDTHLLYNNLHGKTPQWSIDFLCSRFQIARKKTFRSNRIGNSQFHGALNDADTLYNLAITMVKQSLLYSNTLSVFDQIVKNFIM